MHAVIIFLLILAETCAQWALGIIRKLWSLLYNQVGVIVVAAACHISRNPYFGLILMLHFYATTSFVTVKGNYTERPFCNESVSQIKAWSSLLVSITITLRLGLISRCELVNLLRT